MNKIYASVLLAVALFGFSVSRAQAQATTTPELAISLVENAYYRNNKATNPFLYVSLKTKVDKNISSLGFSITGYGILQNAPILSLKHNGQTIATSSGLLVSTTTNPNAYDGTVVNYIFNFNPLLLKANSPQVWTVTGNFPSAFFEEDGNYYGQAEARVMHSNLSILENTTAEFATYPLDTYGGSADGMKFTLDKSEYELSDTVTLKTEIFHWNKDYTDPKCPTKPEGRIDRNIYILGGNIATYCMGSNSKYDMELILNKTYTHYLNISNFSLTPGEYVLVNGYIARPFIVRGPSKTMSVTKSGDGSGTVKGGTINCGTTCSQLIYDGQSIVLTATPASGSVFRGWSGACTGTGTCTISSTGSTTAQARFMKSTSIFQLSVSKSGVGGATKGTVKDSTGKILNDTNCGPSVSTCSASIEKGQSLTLIAVPDAGTVFSITSGTACNGTQSTCTISSVATHVAQSFVFNRDIKTSPLTVSKTGNGSGTISGGAINCGTTCSTTLENGTFQQLTATPASGSRFDGWSGACTGTGTCQATVNGATSVSAQFNTVGTVYYPLTIVRTGTGGGVISGDGVSCRDTLCKVDKIGNQTIVLTATPDADSVLTKLSAGVLNTSTSNTISLPMKATTTVTATFAKKVGATTQLKITMSGSGKGTISSVSSTGSGATAISCDGSKTTECTYTVSSGQEYVLQSSSAQGSGFMGYSGGCTGGSCTIKIPYLTSGSTLSPINISASFDKVPFRVTIISNAYGVVDYTHNGTTKSCEESMTCVISVGEDERVTLNALNQTTSALESWEVKGSVGRVMGDNGATTMLCEDSNTPCSFTPLTDVEIKANFESTSAFRGGLNWLASIFDAWKFSIFSK